LILGSLAPLRFAVLVTQALTSDSRVIGAIEQPASPVEVVVLLYSDRPGLVYVVRHGRGRSQIEFPEAKTRTSVEQQEIVS
jgi:hypothetical protein